MGDKDEASTRKIQHVVDPILDALMRLDEIERCCRLGMVRLQLLRRDLRRYWLTTEQDKRLEDKTP